MKHYVITFVKYNGQPPCCVLLTLQIYYFFLNQQKYYHKKITSAVKLVSFKHIKKGRSTEPNNQKTKEKLFKVSVFLHNFTVNKH